MNLALLGKRIKTLREKQRLTQQQLANTLFVSHQAVSKWERGENAPDLSLLESLARTLDTTIDALIRQNQDEHNLQEASILCLSVREFASKASTLPPNDYATLVNSIHHPVTDLILEENGVPVKYLGDGCLAYFTHKNHASRALKTAQKAIKILEKTPLLITLNQGPIFITKVGHSDFASLDIIGEEVNNVFIMNHWANSQSTSNLIIADHYEKQVDNTLNWTPISIPIKDSQPPKKCLEYNPKGDKK